MDVDRRTCGTQESKGKIGGNLEGEEISLEAQIMAIADVYDAL